MVVGLEVEVTLRHKSTVESVYSQSCPLEHMNIQYLILYQWLGVASTFCGCSGQIVVVSETDNRQVGV